MRLPGVIVWLTGRPASGKSTLAAAVLEKLRDRGREVVWLDSDEVRASRMPMLGYSDRDRDTFYARLGALALEAARHHDVVLVSATAPYARYRDQVRARAARFMEVLVTASEPTLMTRDPKGLYAAARRGAITRLPGVGPPYEPPAHPELVCDTTATTVDRGAGAIESAIERLLAAAPAP